MRNLSNFAILTAVSALAVAYFPAAASAAEQSRSFYQNASASCHGSSPADESRLQRTEQRMRNISGADATVVCSLQTDPLAVMSASYGTVDYVAIWGKRSVALSRKESPTDNSALTCTLVTSYADDIDSQIITQTFTPLPLAAPGGGQGVLDWIPQAGEKFLAPVNVSCILHPQVELNDWIVVYTVDVGL